MSRHRVGHHASGAARRAGEAQDILQQTQRVYARSDRLLWLVIVFLAAVLVGTVVLATLAYIREIDTSQTFANLDVSDNLTVGRGLPLHYVNYGTVAVGTASSNVTTVPVLFGSPPSGKPLILLTPSQASDAYTGLSLTASAVSNTGFSIVASLPDATAQFTQAFSVNWVAMA